MRGPASSPPAGQPAIPPRAEELDRLPPEKFVAATGPFFERAPRFLARLAAARPFGSDRELLAAARAIALAMPEDEQVELVDAHPRLGAPPGSVSALSFAEQGYDRAAAGEAAEAESARVAAELERLNAAYEARFGFRYCVFVAGRSRAALAADLADALRGDRHSELERALDDVIAIAADRLAKVRVAQGTGTEEVGP